MICSRRMGVLSTVRFASPAVTNVPSSFAFTMRCSRIFSMPLASADAGLWNWTTRPIGTGKSFGMSVVSTTSPTLICGRIDPLCTTELCPPSREGIMAIAARLSSRTR